MTEIKNLLKSQGGLDHLRRQVRTDLSEHIKQEHAGNKPDREDRICSRCNTLKQNVLNLNHLKRRRQVRRSQ